MRPIDLSKSLKNYTSGWVALDKKRKVVASGKTFNAVINKVKEEKDVFLVPASKEYFGFVTTSNGYFFNGQRKYFPLWFS